MTKRMLTGTLTQTILIQDIACFENSVDPDQLAPNRLEFQNLRCSLVPEDYFILANRADPDEMPHLVAFHLGLHSLPKCPCRGFQYTKG